MGVEGLEGIALRYGNFYGPGTGFALGGDLVALVRVRENEELADVISNRMRKLKGILETQTLIAFRVYTKEELSGAFDMD